MNMFKYFLPFLLINTIISTLDKDMSNDTPSLQFKKSLVFYRHGNRNPIETFPNDPYKSRYENNFGRLTVEGMKTEFALGKNLSQRYVGNLISKKYSHLEVQIKSSSEERCLQSAYTQLAGLFPPEPDEMWNDKIDWQPIAVYSNPPNKDPLLRPYEDICPNRDNYVESLKKNSKYVKIIESFQVTFEYLTKVTGTSINFDNIWFLYDVFKIEREQNLSLPPWLTTDLEEKIKFLTNLSNNLTFWGEGDEKFFKLAGGPIISEIINIFDHENIVKLHLYSAHDTTLAALKAVLDIPIIPFDEYGSAYALELYEKVLPQDKRLYIQLFSIMKNEVVTIPKCAHPCLLSDFTRLYSSRRSINRAEECGVVEEKINLYKILFYFSLGFLILIAIAFILRTLRANRSVSETLLNNN